jgi:hypothetical protein
MPWTTFFATAARNLDVERRRPPWGWARLARVLLLATFAVVLAASSSGDSRAEGPLAPSPAPAEPPDNALADQGSREQRGFALPTYDRQGYSSNETGVSLKQIPDTGAEWVQLNPTWYQPTKRSSDITARYDTPSDSSVETAIGLAHQARLKVLLKPHLDLLDNTRRSEIRPGNRAAWFTSYKKFISHYAELATRTGVDQFAVGTELGGLSDDRAGWIDVVGAVRARYTGTLTYAANFDEYRHVAFWDAVDLIGVNAYFQLTDGPPADTETLIEEWKPIMTQLGEFAAQTGRKILFTEAGYTSQHGSTTAPWSWTVSDRPDQAEQAAGYEALLESFHEKPWWAGVFWWCWDVPSEDKPSDPLGYTPRGKAAQDVVTSWWK